MATGNYSTSVRSMGQRWSFLVGGLITQRVCERGYDLLSFGWPGEASWCESESKEN